MPMCLLVRVFPVTRRETFLEISMRVRNIYSDLRFSLCPEEHALVHVCTCVARPISFDEHHEHRERATSVPKSKKEKKKKKKETAGEHLHISRPGSNNANER